VDVAFLLRELDDAVADLAGERLPTAQSMPPEEWIAYRKRVAGSDTDEEFSEETIARLEAEMAIRHRSPGELWFDYQRRTPRRRWRALLTEQVAAFKRQIGLADGNIPGIDEPLVDAIARALASPQVREQLPQVRSLRRRPNASRARPDMKLGELAKEWKAARKASKKREDLARVKPASVKKYLGAIQAMTGIEESGHLAEQRRVGGSHNHDRQSTSLSEHTHGLPVTEGQRCSIQAASKLAFCATIRSAPDSRLSAAASSSCLPARSASLSPVNRTISGGSE
jgi:hypothetical protein